MLTGRILVVTPHDHLVDRLSPLLNKDGHVTLTVPSGEEALAVLEEGIIPDVVITEEDMPLDAASYSFLGRFRTLNQLGQHIVVSDQDGASMDTTTFTALAAWGENNFRVVEQSMGDERIREAVSEALDEIREGLQALRGELFRETDRLQQSIRAAQFEMVTALAVTMEAKDPYMRGHCARVAERSVAVATRLGMSGEAVERLRNAALLHEIGKIGISMDLLHRNGPLSREELDHVREYTRIGAEIIGAIPSLASIAPMVRHLHTDYVDLLDLFRDDEGMRRSVAILRVVDAHDAMTTARAYRDTLDRGSWMRALANGAGSEFDPQAIGALMELL